jgi:CMP-N-acetylneuraminic acid synthetase
VSKAVLTTDDEDAAEVGRRCGLERLKPAAGVTGEALVRDAVAQLEAAGEAFDAVCVLDAAKPFRRGEDIDRCVGLLERSGADAVVSVVAIPPEYHPQKVYLQAADGSLTAAGGAEMAPAFQREGSVYVVRRDALMNGGGRTVGYLVDPVRVVNLERPEEWGRAERIARLETHQGTAGRIAPLAGGRLNLPAGWAPTPIADPLVAAGVGLLREGALGSSTVAAGAYLEPVRKAGTPQCREVAAPFAVRDALTPAEREVTAHEFLDPTPTALVMPPSRTGRAAPVETIEDPFRPHAEVAPDIRKAETPLAAALAARRLEGPGLERAREPQRREIAGGSSAVQVAFGIEFSEELGKAAGSVPPVRPFKLGHSELPPARPVRARLRPWPEVVLAAAFFPDPQPLEPASNALAARELLVYTPAFRRDGKLLARRAVAETVRVEVVDTHAAELPGARPLAFVHPLAAVPPAAVRSRARERAAARAAENWERFGQESAQVVFALVASRAEGVKWPSARALQFSKTPERPAKAGSRAQADGHGLVGFPTPEAGVPASADLRTLLRGAGTRKIPAPAIRADGRTVAGAPPLVAQFSDSGEPKKKILLEAVLKAAMMPRGVFHLIEIEDHDDYATWSRAPHYAAELLIRSSGCDVPMPARIGPLGYFAIFAGPYTGSGAHVRVCGEFPAVMQVAIGQNQVGLAAMDFGAIADAGRWRLPFKRAAMFT